MSDAYAPCIDCGDEPGTCPAGRCRDCDIDYVLGQCWSCGQQIVRHEWDADMWRHLFRTDAPPPCESTEHAAGCMVAKRQTDTKRTAPPTTISCASCGETEAEAVAEDLGWRYGTSYDGNANWLCPGCQEPATDAEGRMMGRVR